jgi:signal transduction histidine kinase
VADVGVTIEVRDRGVGIPRDEQEQIFKKFVRGASSRVHGIKGTGIGLAMVRHIVDAHGGQIRVDSAPGRGSTFTIAIPTLPDRRMAGWQEAEDEFSSLKTNPTSH